jgi:hypothetical protein
MGDDLEERYRWAYLLVLAIDAQLKRGTRHFRDRSGRLLQSLDEVVQAILSDNLREELS